MDNPSHLMSLVYTTVLFFVILIYHGKLDLTVDTLTADKDFKS